MSSPPASCAYTPDGGAGARLRQDTRDYQIPNNTFMPKWLIGKLLSGRKLLLMKILSCASATKGFKQFCNNFPRARKKPQLTVLYTAVNSFWTLHVDGVKHNTSPMQLYTNVRNIDLVLQPTVRNRIFKGPHINLSQVKKTITVPLLSVSLYQTTGVAVEAQRCLLKRSIILAPPKI